MHVGLDTALGAQVPGHQLGRVVRRVGDLAQVRVRFVGGVTVVTVVGTLAATEVLVDSGTGEAVEPLHGGAQRIAGQAGLLRQFVDRVGLDDHPGVQPLLRDPLARLQTGEDEPVPVLLIEDQPGRHVLAGSVAPAVLTPVHPVTGLDIRHGLVHEALAGHVDDHRAGRIAFRQREPRRALQWHGRTPPGVLHEVQSGTELFRCDDPVAGVGHRADGPLGADRLTLVLPAHGLVVLEPAAAQNHGAPRLDQPRFVGLRRGGVPDVDAAHHPVLDIEVGERGVEQDRNAGLLQSDSQRCDQGASHPDKVLAARPGPHASRAHLQAAQHTTGVALELVEPHVVLLHHNNIERNLAVGRLKPGHIRTEFLGIERLRLDRPAGGAAPGLLRVVVRVAGHPAHLQGRVLEHEGQHLRTTVEVGVDLLGRHDVADDGVQIGAGGVFGVRLSGALEDLVVGDPHAAARPGRRAAEMGSLLHQHGG